MDKKHRVFQVDGGFDATDPKMRLDRLRIHRRLDGDQKTAKRYGHRYRAGWSHLLKSLTTGITSETKNCSFALKSDLFRLSKWKIGTSAGKVWRYRLALEGENRNENKHDHDRNRPRCAGMKLIDFASISQKQILRSIFIKLYFFKKNLQT